MRCTRKSGFLFAGTRCSRTNIKFSHFLELITVNKPTNEFYLEISYILVVQDFTGFASTINTEFEKIFLNERFG